jgi:hypothetical protein
MILESAQMLCTAHHHYDEKTQDVPYKKKLITITHLTIWVRESDEQYMWFI